MRVGFEGPFDLAVYFHLCTSFRVRVRVRVRVKIWVRVRVRVRVTFICVPRSFCFRNRLNCVYPPICMLL